MTTPRETTAHLPKEGDKAPAFNLPAFPKGNISLDDFKGKKNLILAFYPKDDTPGCTKEMCSFSEDLSKFSTANTEILGISCDTVESHEQFNNKYSLKHSLLADVGGKVGEAYGAVRGGKANANRVLFVIDKEGTIQRIIEGMPNNEELLQIVKELG